MSTETPRPALDVTVRATLDGWPIDVMLSLPAQQIPAALARLAEYGYRPRVEQPAAPAAPAQAPRRPRSEPAYSPDGSPCCPTHGRQLVEGRYGWYCPARAADGEPADKRGYCGLKFD